MNKIVIIGRLTKDPELKATPSGKPVCNFPVADDRPFAENGQREADFHQIVAWGRTAEFISKYFCKGRWIYIVGRLQYRKWQDKNGGNRISAEVVADEVGFCGDRKQAMPEDDGEEEPPRRRASDFGDVEDDNHVPF